MSYVSRVTNINRTVINRTIINNSTNITRINNVLPPQQVLTRNAGLRQITPPALVQGKRLPPAQRLTNIKQAQANLGKPNIVVAPKNLPPLTAQIPKAPPSAAQPVKGGFPGAGLPSKATMPLTPQQQAQIQKLPPNKQIQPVKPPLAGQTTSGVPGQPGAKPGQVQPAVPGKPGQVQPGVTGENLDSHSPAWLLNPVRCSPAASRVKSSLVASRVRCNPAAPRFARAQFNRV